MAEKHMQKLLAWAQLATALAALGTAAVVWYYSSSQLDRYDKQLVTYGQQLAEMQKQNAGLRDQNQQIIAQTFINEAAALSRILHPTPTPKDSYRAKLQHAQQLTFDIIAADALEPRAANTPLINTAAVHELSREREEYLVAQLLLAVQAFRVEQATRAYSADALLNIQREFIATYLLVHPATSKDIPAAKDLACAWEAEKQKHRKGRQSEHTAAFFTFVRFVEEMRRPCAPAVPCSAPTVPCPTAP
jgi:hypothetical protein